MKFFCPDEIRRWHKAFKQPNELFEIRMIEGRSIQSGYFADVESAIRAIEPYEKRQTFQIYFTVNEVNPACSSRKQFNQFLSVQGSATSKGDIVHRRWLPIDIDVVRPTDISSTDEEKEYAHKKAQAIYTFMREKGFPSPIVCDSSSGYHLYYPIDTPSNDKIEKLIKDIYQILFNFFSDERIKIDSSVGDANRIMRLPGTWGRKGRDSEERPHRMARILSIPDVISPVGVDFLSAFERRYRVVKETPSYRQYNGESFDLRTFISEHGLKVKKESDFNGLTKFVLEECPFDSSHKAPDSALFLSPNGAIGFKCFHDSCSHHDWHELREMLDPTAYVQKTQKYDRSQEVRLSPQAKRIEIKPENAEIGKKWLSIDDIEDVNVDDLPRIKTGFHDIDIRLGGGLFLSQLTIISGINGSGKSSWLNTLILNSIQEGNSAALWTGELQASRLKRWLIQAAAGPYHVMESKISPGKYYVPKNIIEKISEWMRGKFLLYNNEYSSNYAQIIHDMEEPAKKGFKLFILDNLFSMSLDGIEGDENTKQKELILQLSQFAKNNNTHIILVAHPRKVVTFLRKEDILGSSAISNAADVIFIIHRTGPDFEKRGCEMFNPAMIKGLMSYGNVVEICKDREYGSMSEFFGMHYDTKSRRFNDDYSQGMVYGWEGTTQQAEISFHASHYDDNEEAPF